MTAAELIAELSKLPAETVVMGYPPDSEHTSGIGPLTPTEVATLTADVTDKWGRPQRCGWVMELSEAKYCGIPESAYRVSPGVVVLN